LDDFSIYPDNTPLCSSYTVDIYTDVSQQAANAAGGLTGWQAWGSCKGHFYDSFLGSLIAPNMAIVAGAVQQLTRPGQAVGNFVKKVGVGNFTAEFDGASANRRSIVVCNSSGLTINNLITADVRTGGSITILGGSASANPNFPSWSTSITLNCDFANKRLTVSFDGILWVDVNGVPYVWDLTPLAAYDPSGFYIGYANSFNTALNVALDARIRVTPTAVSNLTVFYGQPISDGNGGQMVQLFGGYVGTAPTGITLQMSDLASGVITISDEQMTNLVVDTTKKTWTAQSASSVPLVSEGIYTRIAAWKTNVPGDSSIFTKFRTAYHGKPKLGINSGAFSYYTVKDGYFLDWARRCSIQINGGTYGGMDMPTLYANGIVNQQGQLIVYPSDATSIYIVLPWYPHPDDCGLRDLIMPPGQKITMNLNGGAAAAGFTFTSNPTTGVHTINVPTNLSLQNTYFIIDKASFLSHAGYYSMRKRGDTSGLIWGAAAVAHYSRFQVIRFMDQINTNNGGNWLNFTNRFHWGFDVEALVELCNRTLAYPWICAGYNATATETAKFVAYMEANLDPRILTIHADWFNEDWGGILADKTAFLVKGALAGRNFGDGRGGPVDPNHWHFYTTGVPGGGLGAVIPAGDYIAAYQSGYTYLGIWLVNTTTATTDQLPAAMGSNSQFTFIVAGELGWAREHGVQCYNFTVACKAASPRLKVAHNAQTTTSTVPGTGDFDYIAMLFTQTAGGTDCWANVCDAIACAPYPGITNASAVSAATAGSARIAVIDSQISAAAVAGAGPWLLTARQRFQYFLDKIGRNVPAQCWSYEFGPSVAGTWTTSVQTDLVNWWEGLDPASHVGAIETQMINDIAAYAEVLCIFNDGFLGIPSGVPSQGIWNHFTQIDDTTSALAAADLERAAHYASL
jgi:hypothetical protein